MQSSSLSQKITTEKLRSENKEMKDTALYNECYSRRDNLKLLGIPERRNEDCEAVVMDICHNAGLDFHRGPFIRVHRLCRFTRNRSSPIIARFHHFKDRGLVWNCPCMIISQQEVPVTEDYS